MKYRLTTLAIALLITFSVSFAQSELKLLTSIHGENNGEYFSSVDAIGDVNGDTYDDFIVGDDGKYVKLYLGASPFDTLNCMKFLQGVRKRVYASSAGKGDLNGDGYNDFILNTLYDVNDYRIEIYYGGKELDTLPDLTITNNIWYSNFGARSMTGDLNGDGYDDLVVSAPVDDYDVHGRLYIYFGGKEMDTVCDVFLEGKEPGDMFGGSAAIIGDVNGDGYDDLLVGAPQVVKQNGHGKAYLFFGGNKIGFDNFVEFFGDSTTRSYGQQAAGLGDINNDGYKDFGITSYGYIDIVLGGINIGADNIFHMMYKEASFIGDLGDLNKDKYDDYVITTRNVNMYFGGTYLDTSATIKMTTWGRPVCSLGDINGDGKTEIAVGYSYGENASGMVNIYTYNGLSAINKPVAKSIPKDLVVQQSYPNPFNPTTTVSYTLYKEQDITIEIFNSIGQKIKTLFSGLQQPGVHNIRWDAIDNNNAILPSGIYFLRFSSIPVKEHKTKQQEVIKMVLMR
jgi:hypothetical protein